MNFVQHIVHATTGYFHRTSTAFIVMTTVKSLFAHCSHVACATTEPTAAMITNQKWAGPSATRSSFTHDLKALRYGLAWEIRNVGKRRQLHTAFCLALFPYLGKL